MILGLAVTSRTLDHQAGVGSRMLTSLQHSPPPITRQGLADC